MRICEIYDCVQGELPNMGVPITMCRLQGCPAPHCRWCDTGYALDPMKGEERSIKFLEIRLSFSNFICFSGGEPLMQEKELSALVKNLREGRVIEIETSAFYPPPKWVKEVDYWVIDYKCPSSGRESTFIENWTKVVGTSDAVKFVVSNANDLSFAIKNKVKGCKNIISPALSKNGVSEELGRVVISVTQIDWIREVERFCIKNNFLFSLQQHRIVWGLRKGV